MSAINSIHDLQMLVKTGERNWKQFGEVYTRELDDLTLFNYLPTAQYAAVWTPLELMSRGLILNRLTGEIVARPFDKFFNWLEGGRKASGHIITVTEKMDGSLGILFRHNEKYHITTRGGFNTEQGLWATDYLNANHNLDGLSDEYTLLFEIIYPENRIVVDYGSRCDLVLLAVRNRFTGDYLPFFPDVYELAHNYGFSTPAVYSFNDVSEIITTCGSLDISKEGFVIEFSDGSRWKMKGDRYLELHKLIASISFKNTLRAMANGTLQAWMDTIPDEFLTDVRVWMAEIQAEIESVQVTCKTAFEQAPRETRKDFALWVQSNHKPIMSYLFAMLDGKSLEPMIFKALENRRDRFVLKEAE